MSLYAPGDWIFAPGIGMAEVVQRITVGEKDWMLTCKIAGHPNALIKVLAKDVEPGHMPSFGPRLVCVDGVRVAA